jgi:hypothetical protein
VGSLKPLNFQKEQKKYEAFSEERELSFARCPHKQAKMVGNELRCPCGASWTGPRIRELKKILTGKD